jgi:hypothetical protein
VEQGLVIEEITQGQEGLDTQAWCRRIAHAATRERIEHPRGNGQLQAIRALDDQTLRSLTP